MEGYKGKDALWYDNYVANSWSKADIEFYVSSALEAKGNVLELGCGTGRILIPTAQAGVKITGLDLSADMLGIAQEKTNSLPSEIQLNISLIEGSMIDFNLKEQYNLITIPFRAFLHVIQVEDQKRTLSNIRNHLKENGKLIFNIFDPNLKIISDHMNNLGMALKGRCTFNDPQSGNRIIGWDSRSYNLADQTIDEMRVYDELDTTGKVINRTYIPLSLRFCYRFEIMHLIERCGLKIEALYGDFNKGRFKSGGEQVWVCGKQ